MKTNAGIGTLAFFQRAFGKRRRPFQDISQRSTDALKGLSATPDSLQFQIALRQLRYDWDLLTEEAARDDDALRLQMRVLDLAPGLPEADRLLRPGLGKAPLSRLFWAILAQGRQDGARAISLRFGTSGDAGMSVVFDTERGEVEAMTIPASLDEGMRGQLRFIERAGYARVHAYLHPDLPSGLPRRVEFARIGPNEVVLTLSS